MATVKTGDVSDNTRLKQILEAKIASYLQEAVAAGEAAASAKTDELAPLVTAAQAKIVELETALATEAASVVIS